MKTKALLIAAMSMALLGCVDFGDQYKTERANLEVIDIDPPKRFRIMVMHRETGTQHLVYISKRCANWERNTQIGMRVPIMLEYRRYRDGSETVHARASEGLREKLCA